VIGVADCIIMSINTS